jgi:hypothetical protein
MTNKKVAVKYSRYRYIIIVAVIIILVVVLIAGTSSSKPMTATKPAQDTQKTVVSNDLTGYGATQSSWDTNHIADSRYTVGSAYNQNTKYAQGSSAANDDEYYAVNALAGSITNYSMRFVSDQTIDEVKPTVLKEFPTDTTILWEQLLNTDSTNSCYQIEVTSPTLAKTLGGSGNAFVELFTEPARSAEYSSYYDSSNVNSATINNLDVKTMAQSTGC